MKNKTENKIRLISEYKSFNLFISGNYQKQN